MRRYTSAAVLFLAAVAGPISAGASGGLDTSYATHGVATVVTTHTGGLHEVVRTQDGMLFGLVNSPEQLYRAYPDGTLDSGFGNGGLLDLPFVTPHGRWGGVAAQSDGRVLVSAMSDAGTWIMRRYLADGTLDSSFGVAGQVEIDPSPIFEDAPGVWVMADGKIMLTGRAGGDAGMARFNADGSPDLTFGTGGLVTVDYGNLGEYFEEPIVYDNGDILLGIISGFGSADGAFGMARFHDDGTPDTTFGGGAGFVAVPHGGASTTDVALLPDGKILMTGMAPADIPSRDFIVLRFLSDGTLDPTFGSGGIVIHDLAPGDADESQRLVPLPNGQFFVVGQVNVPGPLSEEIAVARYNADGSIDTTFGSGGLVIAIVDDFSQPISTIRLPDGDLLVSGSSFPLDVRNFLLRFTPCGPCDVVRADGTCAAPPPSGCIGTTAPSSSKLELKDDVRDAKDRLSWMWKRGGATGAGDFGDPAADSQLRFCLYTGAPTDPVPLVRMALAAGDQCGAAPCWKGVGAPPGTRGWKRKEKDGLSDGVVLAALRSGQAGKSKIMLKAKGIRVPLPSLPLATPLHARLQSSTGQCWEAEFTSPIVNTATKFKAVGE
jgi:uncharacterized delta-60 repeat protein